MTTANTDPADGVKELIAKAVDSPDANDAMKFSQAAVNSANALIGLKNAEIGTETK